ncbi:MAG TPA: ribbon-helix-helix protein, CopG family [Thermoanaerobaculia bacterium]|nr:ribbon-helix-helix protein, CopG family [Thermoanaerobaculia bacterium]
MARFTRRAQVLLSEDQYRSLQSLAEAEGKPLGALLREAAEEVYFREEKRNQKARAARQILSLPITDVPEDYQEWERRYLDERSEGHG